MSRDKILTKYRKENYKTIHLKMLEDEEELSWKAKGLHTYLITRPDGWEFNYTDLIKRSSEGRTAVHNAIEELKEHGYLEIKQERDENSGKFSEVQWIVAQSPDMLENPPNADNPNTGNPISDNRNTSSNSSCSSNRKNSNNSVSDGSETNKDEEEQEKLQEIFDYWVRQKSTVSHRKFKESFKSAIRARLEDGFSVSELKEAISIYDKNNRATNTYWSYDAWSIKQFMSRDSGGHVETFLEKPKTYIEDGSNEFKFKNDNSSQKTKTVDGEEYVYNEEYGWIPKDD